MTKGVNKCEQEDRGVCVWGELMERMTRGVNKCEQEDGVGKFLIRDQKEE